MPPAGFEPTISAVEQPQTYALGRASVVTGTSRCLAKVKSLCLIKRQAMKECKKVGPGNITVCRRADAVPERGEFAAPAGSLTWSDFVAQL
jgi:hypothetical protein